MGSPPILREMRRAPRVTQYPYYTLGTEEGSLQEATLGGREGRQEEETLSGHPAPGR